MAGLIFFWLRPCEHYDPAEPAGGVGTVFDEKDPVLTAELFPPKSAALGTVVFAEKDPVLGAALYAEKAGSNVTYNRRLPQPWCHHE